MPQVTVPQAFQLAVQHHQAGRLAEAEGLYRQVLSVQPNHADAWHLLGVVAHHSGRRDLSVPWIRHALTLDPRNAEAHYNLANALRDNGSLTEAIASFQQTLALQPEHAAAHNNLGMVLSQLGRFSEAIEACRRAAELQPDLALAYYNLGNALRDLGRLEEAIAAYRKTLEIEPRLPEGHNNLAVALLGQGRLEESTATLRRAMELRPAFPEAENNLGTVLTQTGEIDEAIAACRRSLALQPDGMEAWNTLGNALREAGQLDEALAAYRRGVELTPAHSAVYSSLLFTLHQVPGLDGSAIADEQQRWNRRLIEDSRRFFVPHGNERNPTRRLRLGYVSPDFRQHVVGRNILPLFRHHDREQFEIYCYSGGLDLDVLTDEFRRHADHWRSSVGLDDEALARQIRADGVDILVDLAQHTSGNRLPAFAHRPAPVQVSFAGYPEGTGLEAIQYRISDRWLEGEPQMQDGTTARSHLETCELHPASRIFLLDSFWCYDPCGTEVDLNPLPARELGHVTFGSFTSFWKINPAVLRLWSRVLAQVPDSRLLLLSSVGSHRQRALEHLTREGIAESRVEFLPRCSRAAYLALHHHLDIALDPFPYGGHTTSLDALWMGVPVVSLAGERPVSRAGLSQLSNLNLRELVAASEDDYVRIAASLAQDWPRLADLRATLRTRMENSVLMNAPHFTRQIEAAYRAMWREWCASPPQT